MITAIDSNILIDIFGADPKFGKHSAETVRSCIQEGSLHACEVVWTEVATVFKDNVSFQNIMQTLGIEYSALTQKTAIVAATAWRQYRDAGGKRERVAADFLIGAHALTQCDRLLTRDRGFYRKYFDSLTIIDPTMITA